MVKVKVYFRIAKTGKGVYKVRASMKLNTYPVGRTRPNPTVAFAIVFDIPDDKFKEAEKVIAEIPIGNDKITIPIEIEKIESEQMNIEQMNEGKDVTSLGEENV
jgi:hypothetical protein